MHFNDKYHYGCAYYFFVYNYEDNNFHNHQNPNNQYVIYLNYDSSAV
jgi:hypothetical protein